MPHDVYEIRARNLKHLRGDKRGGQRDMAVKLGMSEAQLSQYIGKTRQKTIGSALARKIERRLKLPRGWLDNRDGDLTEEGAAVGRRFQALTPEQQKAIKQVLDTFHP